jgi:hypothetical protein
MTASTNDNKYEGKFFTEQHDHYLLVTMVLMEDIFSSPISMSLEALQQYI